MNKNTLDYDNFLCLVLPIVLFVLFSFVFLLPSSFYSCNTDDTDDNDDYIMYYRPEGFTDDTTTASPPVSTPAPTNTVTSLPATSLPSATIVSNPLPSTSTTLPSSPVTPVPASAPAPAPVPVPVPVPAPVPVPSCVDTNSIIIGNNICYSCPIGSSLNSTNDGCTGTATTPLSCIDPNAQLIGDSPNAMCYGCPPGQIYDSSQLSCVSTAATPLNASTNMQYKCLDDNDTLVGTSCYACDGKDATFNPITMKCETVVNAYNPINTYNLPNSTSSCKTGYFQDFKTCNQCNNNDTYKSGWGCLNTSSAPPAGVVPAVVNDNPFSPDSF